MITNQFFFSAAHFPSPIFSPLSISLYWQMLSEDKEDERGLKLTLFNYADTEMIKLSKNSVFHCLFDSDSNLNKFMDSVKVHFVFT